MTTQADPVREMRALQERGELTREVFLRLIAVDREQLQAEGYHLSEIAELQSSLWRTVPYEWHL